jgi:carbonic anhydrase
LLEELLCKNREYAAGFTHGDLDAPPRLKLAIVTCMDARIDPVRILGLAPGDAHVIRNAGGVVTADVVRSLAISQHGLGTEAIVVMQHTQCGLLTLSEEEFARQAEAATGVRPPWPTHAFSDLEASVREGVAALRGERLLPRRERVSGLVYDVATGRLGEIA